MQKTMMLVILVLGLCILGTSGAMAVPFLGFDPASQIVDVGDSISVDVYISGLGEGVGSDIVSAFDIDVSYDPGVLAATGVTFGSELGVIFLPTYTDVDMSTSGVVGFNELSIDSDFALQLSQHDTFTLATLGFDVISLGSSSLAFTNVSMVTNDALPLIVDAGSGSVATVPEPSTIILTAFGMAGMIGCLRKRYREPT